MADEIAEVGRNVTVPSGAEVIDATGRFVSPGIIDCHSHIAADSINEGGTTVSSMTGIEDVFNPTDIDIYRDLAGGLTTANVLHGSANPIGGKNYVIKLRWGKPHAEDFKFEGAMPGIKFALGENPKDMRQFGQQGPRRYPSSRLGVEYVIRDAFTRAKAYQAAWKAYDAKKKTAEGVLPPRRDLQLEPLVEVLEGKRLVHAHCYRSDEILMLLRLADEMGFKVATLQHALEAYRVAPEIKAHGAGVSTFADWWGYKVEASGATPWNAAMCLRRGIVVSINSDSAEHARRLNTEAAKMIKYGGLTEDEALALVTINPAKQLRIDNHVGSIEVGKDADVVIWNHHPLSSYALADRVYIDGTLYYDRSKEDQRVTDLKTKKDALLKAEKDAAEKAKAEKTDKGDKKAPEGPPPASPSEPAPAAERSEAAPARAERGPVPAAVHITNDAPAIAITNARIVPVTSPVIEKGTIVIKGGRIVALGRDVAVPARRRRHRRRRQRGLSGLDRAVHVARARRTGPARVPGHVRADAAQPGAAHARRVPRRKRRHPRRAIERRHDRRRRAGRRHPRRRGRGHESRRLDVGAGHPAPVRRHLDAVPAGAPAAAFRGGARARRVLRRPEEGARQEARRRRRVAGAGASVLGHAPGVAAHGLGAGLARARDRRRGAGLRRR